MKDRVYIDEVSRNLEFARDFLTKLVQDPERLDSIPEGALLVPYAVPTGDRSARGGRAQASSY